MGQDKTMRKIPAENAFLKATNRQSFHKKKKLKHATHEKYGFNITQFELKTNSPIKCKMFVFSAFYMPS